MQRTNSANLRILNILRKKWIFFSIACMILWILVFLGLRLWWDEINPTLWLTLSGVAMGYLLGIVWRGLKDNHRHGEEQLLSRLGLGNQISIGRGFILVIFCGFLFSPLPENGWKAWVPGLLYTMATLPDFLDGAVARLMNHVTVLGERLDISLDSLGVLAVSALAVQYGKVPWWFLSVGLARYLFLGGIWLRQTFGLPAHDLPFSIRRRGFAGLMMGFFFVILYPIFRPPGTSLAATVFGFYLLGGFLYDWFIVCGWIPNRIKPVLDLLQKGITSYFPLMLRLILTFWVVFQILPELYLKPTESLVWLEAGVGLCLILGIAGRAAAIIALVVLGLQQAPDIFELWRIILYSNLLFLGTGSYSLFPVENRLIYHRIGDPG